MNVYLDNAATTPLSDGMKNYLISLLDDYGNPSSQYGIGRKNRTLIDEARRTVSKFVGLPECGRVIFTSGGSASNALAVNCCSPWEVAHSSTMHESMLLAAGEYPIECDQDGFIDLDSLEEIFRQEYSLKLICVEHANSECGTIQNIKKIAKIAHEHDVYIYVDCTGSIASIPINMKETGVDAIGFSAHKIGGLKGVGAFCVANGSEIGTDDYFFEPIVYGEQNYHMYGGTENVLGIGSLKYAIEHHKYNEKYERTLVNYIWEKVHKQFPDSYLIGPNCGSKLRLPNNLYMCIKGIYGEALVELLDQCGIQVSTGSACSTGHESQLLKTLKIPKVDRHSCIRVTLGGTEDISKIQYATEKMIECIRLLYETK